MLPLALDLTGQPVLVVGCGRVGAGRVALLAGAGAAVDVVTREVLCPAPGARSVVRRAYRAGDLVGYRLVVAATGDRGVNAAIAEEARARGVWMNAVDDPSSSDAYFMALWRDGPVTLAVSTDGQSPALAQVLRDRAAGAMPAGVAEVAARIGAERRAVHAGGESTEGRDWRARIAEALEDYSRSDR